jgi:uncharacterized SAM-dependent methyltransferase
MALISNRPQTVTLAGRRWEFSADEPLITEYRVKYTPLAFRQLAQRAGWSCVQRWSDATDDLSLHLLEPADPACLAGLEPDSLQQHNDR